MSTLEQDEALQLDALKAAGCVRTYTDHASGVASRRPQMERLVERLEDGDTLVVWRLDRLGRSLKHLIELVTGLGDRGVHFRSLTEQLDTSSAGGRLIFHVMGAFAEFEHQLIRERTVAGLAAARSRGRSGGRPPVMTETKAELARAMYDSQEHTVEAIAEALGVSRATVYNSLRT